MGGRERPAARAQVGAETFRLCQQLVDGVVLVDNSAISAAIRDVFNETRSILEPAGAVAVAGAKAYLRRHGLQVRGRGPRAPGGHSGTRRLPAALAGAARCGEGARRPRRRPARAGRGRGGRDQRRQHEL